MQCYLCCVLGLPFLSCCVPELEMDPEVPLSHPINTHPCVHLNKSITHAS